MATPLHGQHATDERRAPIADRLSEVVERRTTGTEEHGHSTAARMIPPEWSRECERRTTRIALFRRPLACGAGDRNRTDMTSLQDAPSGPKARRFSFGRTEVVTASRYE